MEGQPMNLYHEARKISPEKARELIRKVLKGQGGNVTQTARILEISRATVRRARDGDAKDRSRRPHRSPRRTEEMLEGLVVREGRLTSFRYRRLTKHLAMKFSLVFSEHTVRAILRRNRVTRKVRRSASGSIRHLYDYEHLVPFTEFQLDTKHLLDQKALPEPVYEHIRHAGLPLFEWHLMDAATRTRFLAYSYTLNAAFGFLFLVIVLSWLKAHNVRTRMRIRVDNGAEFCSGSQAKLRDWNARLAVLGASLDPIPPGASHLQGLVENAHRIDDECFLMVHAERCAHTYQFLARAQAWQDTWNFFRPSFGLGMKGKTPGEKLKGTGTMVHEHVLLFPVMLLEDLQKVVGSGNELLLGAKGGQYVYDTCQNTKVLGFFSTR
jgi:putative transposase